MRRFWLALIVLLATFSSAPAGSVQQGAFERGASTAPPPALAVARSDGEFPVAELLADLPSPSTDPVALRPVQPPFSGLPNTPASWCPVPFPGDRTDCLSLLERLPYDATAPPLLG
jgi:hypothetical protein